MIFAFLCMGVLFVMVIGAWIAINPPTKWLHKSKPAKDKAGL